MIDSKKLQYFLAVAEELHVGRAAERLGMAQPPLSRQIQALEQELGAQLFHRGRNSISLTQAGERFRERVSKVLDDLEDAQIEARRIAQGAEGRLRVGFVGSASYGVLPNIIKSFRKHYPQITLSLVPMNNAALRRSLIRHEIDIAIARPAIVDQEVISKLLVTEPLILAVPDSDPLSDRDLVALSDIADKTLVLYPERPRPSFADQILDLMVREGFPDMSRVFTMDFQSAIALVSVNEGVSVVPASVGENQRTGVRFVKLKNSEACTSLSINFRIDNQAIHVQNFVNISARVAKKTLG